MPPSLRKSLSCGCAALFAEKFHFSGSIENKFGGSAALLAFAFIHYPYLMTFTLSPADESMIDDILLIADQCGLAPWSRNDYLAEIGRPDSIFLVLHAGPKLTGFIVGRIIPGREAGHEAELYNIGISPDFRRLGGGKMLLESFLSECVNRGATSVWLEVRASNANAIKLYEKAGFIKQSLRKQYFSDPLEDAIIMQMKLA